MPPRKKKVKAGTVGIDALAVAAETPPPKIAALAAQVAADGGAVLATYREPFGSKWVLLASLPIAKIQPTPYQRELSKTHADRLAGVIPKVGMFLDPLVAVHAGGSFGSAERGGVAPLKDTYWTPNGMHRLAAMNQLGAQAVIVLLVPEPEIAYRILALNTEKAHNLKDKSLEVIRMARGLAADPLMAKRPESEFAFEFEEPAYLTVGMCYDERPRFSGGAYLSILKRCESFSDDGIAKSLAAREPHKAKVLEVDDAVADLVAKLKAAGLTSPYLKPFVVARLNPLRWIKADKPGQKAPRALFDQTFAKMLDAAAKFDVKKVKPQDLQGMAGSPPEAE